MNDHIQALNDASEALGPEHAADVRQARAALRNAYLQMRALVTGDPQFAPIDLLDMDHLDRMVFRWVRDRHVREQASAKAREAVAAAVAGERVANG